MLVYKIVDAASWRRALSRGRFDGSSDDARDGFIHLSTAAQLPSTLAKHFAGRDDLVIAAFEEDELGPPLKWEPSRGGALFPHFYAPLRTSSAIWWRPLPLGADGNHTLSTEVK